MGIAVRETSEGAARPVRFSVRFFLGLLIVSYILMKFILYATRVIAYYFMYGVEVVLAPRVASDHGRRREAAIPTHPRERG